VTSILSRREFARRAASGAAAFAGLPWWRPGSVEGLSAPSGGPAGAPGPRPANPVLPGWYADPEAHVFDGRYWIYPTYSAPYDEQLFMDAFSSADLVTWEKHPGILDATDVSWARRALWAPSVVEKDGTYYLFFSANDIQDDDEEGGLGVAVSDRPGGPFEDTLGRPLIGRFHNGAQPIDPYVFRDADGAHYLIYGGWRHCNIARLNDAFTGFRPWDDGTTFREITPEGYVEGSFMLLRGGRYYFMWSEGGWTGPDYAVAYSVADSPAGPFERAGRILQQDPSVATGAGHHSVLHAPASGRWYIVYHRRPLGETDRNHRVVCIDEMRFDEDGFIVPVRITHEGVGPDPAGG
jgi:beta-xylosidase